jgi:hypothetical protein
MHYKVLSGIEHRPKRLIWTSNLFGLSVTGNIIL